VRTAAVTVSTAAVLLVGAPGWAATAAGPPEAMPVAAVSLPAQVEQPSPYLPQVSCDPNPKPGVQAFEELILNTFQHGHSGGITRDCDAPGVAGGRSEHKEGRAWDWMLDGGDYADQVAGTRAVNWLLADDAVNARRLGVMYLIWNRRIWSAHDAATGWRPYDYGDPHTSHVHFSFSWAGAEKRTSWWTGKVAPTEFGPCQEFVDEPAPAYGDQVNLSPCPAPGPARSRGKLELNSAPADPAPAPLPVRAPAQLATPTPGDSRTKLSATGTGRERCPGPCRCC